jgi:hypothetical protein
MPGNRLPLKILEWEPDGTQRRGRPKERWTDGVRRSMTNHGLTEEDTKIQRQMAKLSFGWRKTTVEWTNLRWWWWDEGSKEIRKRKNHEGWRQWTHETEATGINDGVWRTDRKGKRCKWRLFHAWSNWTLCTPTLLPTTFAFHGLMHQLHVTIQVLTAASMNFIVFWDVAPCSHVKFTDVQRCVLPPSSG